MPLVVKGRCNVGQYSTRNCVFEGDARDQNEKRNERKTERFELQQRSHRVFATKTGTGHGQAILTLKRLMRLTYFEQDQQKTGRLGLRFELSQVFFAFDVRPVLAVLREKSSGLEQP
jgi:hypothetical protein